MSLLQLEEYLRHPLVAPTTISIFNALLQGSVNQEYFATYVVRETSEKGAQKHYKAFERFMNEMDASVGPMSGGSHTGHVTGGLGGGGVGININSGLRTGVPMMPDRLTCDIEALNEEATRWMSDFLLYIVCKRKRNLHKQRWSECWTREYHDIEDEDMPGLADKWFEQGLIYDRVMDRDGPFCALTGETVNLVAVQLLPQSEDRGRFDRFCELAAIFWNHIFDRPLKTDLSEVGNAFMLTEEWMELLDEGRIVFHPREDDKFLCRALDEETLFRLMRDRVLNGLEYEAPCLEFDYDDSDYTGKPLQACFTVMHASIVETWHATGLAETLLAQVKYVDDIPAKLQNYDGLGEQGFSRVLSHCLAIY